MTTKEFNRCLQLLKKGDRQAMAALYIHYYEKMKFYAELEVHSESDAEDIASDVLADIFEHAANYGYVDKPDAYMYRAVKFAVINFKKKNAKYVYTELMDEIYPAKDNNWELKMDLKRALQTMPERDREIVQLHYIFGLTIQATAKQLNISVSTVNRTVVSIKDEMEKFKKNQKET